MAGLQLLGTEYQEQVFSSLLGAPPESVESGGSLANSAIQRAIEVSTRGWRSAGRRLAIIPEARRSAELRWRQTHREELHRYSGQWVALEGARIIAHGASLGETVGAARAQGVKVPYVFRVDDLDPEAATIGL